MPLFSALFTVPTSTVSDVFGYVSDQFTDVGTWSIVAAVAAVPLLFFIIYKIIGIFRHPIKGSKK